MGENRKGKPQSIPPYERTLEIRKKISDTLKEGYKSGRIAVNKDGIS